MVCRKCGSTDVIVEARIKERSGCLNVILLFIPVIGWAILLIRAFMRRKIIGLAICQNCGNVWDADKSK